MEEPMGFHKYLAPDVRSRQGEGGKQDVRRVCAQLGSLAGVGMGRAVTLWYLMHIQQMLAV